MTVLTPNERAVLEMFEAAGENRPPSNGQIAAALGWTLNAAAGTCRRLRVKGLIPKRPRRDEPWPPVVHFPAAMQDPRTDHIPFAEAKHALSRGPRCQYLVRDFARGMKPAEIDACKCGAPAMTSKPYCSEHWRRCNIVGSRQVVA